ncbi:signal recognition particle 9 kDa protein [Prionailurus iriomotensis]
MPQYQTWEEFSRAAEKLYLADPMKARVVLKYRHSDGSLCIKVTDDLVAHVNPSDGPEKKDLLLQNEGKSCQLKFDIFEDCRKMVFERPPCLVYRTDQAQDVKKIEKFHSQLMRLMVAKESRSVAMETD